MDDELQKALQASMDFHIEEEKVKSKVNEEYQKQQREMEIKDQIQIGSGATPMGAEMSTEEKIKAQSQMEEDEFQFLCDMFLGMDDGFSCSTGIGDLIQKDEIRSLLSKKGFDQTM